MSAYEPLHRMILLQIKIFKSDKIVLIFEIIARLEHYKRKRMGVIGLMNGDFIEPKRTTELYHQMVLIRRVEERGAELYQQGKIGGFMHLYIGQEAVSPD